MKVIFLSLIASAIGLFILFFFRLHDLISQKRLQAIIDKEKEKRQAMINQNSKTKKKVLSKDIGISIHDKDIPNNVYLVFGGGVIACCLLIVAAVVFHLITGAAWWW